MLFAPHLLLQSLEPSVDWNLEPLTIFL